MKEESPMTQDIDAFDAFLFGMRVVLHAFELDPPATEFERPWTLLREIAEGRTTLMNPGDSAARFPGLGALLQETTRDRIAQAREMAVRTLRGLGRSFGDATPGCGRRPRVGGSLARRPGWRRSWQPSCSIWASTGRSNRVASRGRATTRRSPVPCSTSGPRAGSWSASRAFVRAGSPSSSDTPAGSTGAV